MTADERLTIALAALHKIAKMGRVCDDFELCTHHACNDSAAACITARDALNEITSERLA